MRYQNQRSLTDFVAAICSAIESGFCAPPPPVAAGGGGGAGGAGAPPLVDDSTEGAGGAVGGGLRLGAPGSLGAFLRPKRV